MNKYIIGVDGGGTSTDGALFLLDGTIVKTVQSGFANFRVDAETAKRHLLETLNKLTAGIDLRDLAMIQIGIAGVPNEPIKMQLETELSLLYKTPVSIVTDALIALYSIRRDQDGCVVMVLGGTGSAIMVGDATKHELIGGFGHLLGDEGSAYHLAISGLKEVIRQYENSEVLTPLSLAILEQIRAKTHLQIKDFVYTRTKQDIAKLSLFIGQRAEQGDEDAIALFIAEGELLAEQTFRALNKLPHCNNLTIGLRGSFLLHAPYVKDTFLSKLDAKALLFNIDLQPVDPVIGAFYLGLQQLKSR